MRTIEQISVDLSKAVVDVQDKTQARKNAEKVLSEASVALDQARDRASFLRGEMEEVLNSFNVGNSNTNVRVSK